MVAYAGSIYLDRDPRNLFRAASSFVEARHLSPADFGIELMGSAEKYNGVSIEELASQEGLDGFVRVWPRGSRTAAMEFLAGAAMLLSLPQDSVMAIPSKVFEYMSFDAWLLALADEESATARLLADSGADVVAPDDVDGIAAVLGRRFDEYRSEGPPRQPALVPTASRAAQAGELFSALHEMLGLDNEDSLQEAARR